MSQDVPSLQAGQSRKEEDEEKHGGAPGLAGYAPRTALAQAPRAWRRVAGKWAIAVILGYIDYAQAINYIISVLAPFFVPIIRTQPTDRGILLATRLCSAYQSFIIPDSLTSQTARQLDNQTEAKPIKYICISR
ncbi:hypothetical protein BDDG_00922 [Blastomyces dermatitidis ATCC 18188]|uniref:Uncharacterized protein n=1 Tax=Ajellomyces dermatitidis (strain ATCC 18188 / CBS 674.68) TaxID=653446 RepID=F2T3I3_AJEDA|nr:hypothetical protein BDDG_00922 [Blastomyces dermatitidis ATCC 18188]EQL38280.1 hypothetical protein BDFG_00646 [Blastomyces dermatitidis ATCC 26199]